MGNVRIARTIRAADMAAARASLAPTGEEGLALVAGPADTLARLLVDQVLPSSLGRLGELEVGLVVNTPVGDNGRVRGGLLGLGGPALAAGLLLLLGALGRVASALLAPDVLAARAFLGYTKRGVAQVAVAADAHADRLLGAEGGSLGRPPFAGVDLEAESLAELLGALLVELATRHTGDAFGDLGFGLGRFTGAWLASGTPRKRCGTTRRSPRHQSVDVQLAGWGLDVN